jgi:hypothetical protein
MSIQPCLDKAGTISASREYASHIRIVKIRLTGSVSLDPGGKLFDSGGASGGWLFMEINHLDGHPSEVKGVEF